MLGSFRIHSLKVVGYALSAFLMIFLGWPLFNILIDYTSIPQISLLRTIQAFCFALMLLAIPLVRRHTGDAPFLFGANAFLLVGCVLFFGIIVFTPETTSIILPVVASLCLAVGRAGVAVAWISIVSSDSAERIIPTIVSGWVIASLVGIAFSSASTYPLLYFLFAVISIVLNIVLTKAMCSGKTKKVKQGSTVVPEGFLALLRSFWSPVLLIALLGFVSQMVKTLFLPTSTILGLQTGLFTFLCTFVAAIILTFLQRYLTESTMRSTLLRIFSFVVITCCVALPVIGITFSLVVTTVVSVVSILASMALIAICVSDAKAKLGESTFVFCLFLGFYHLSLTLGSVVGFVLHREVISSGIFPAAVALVCIWVLSCFIIIVEAYQSKGRNKVASSVAAQSSESGKDASPVVFDLEQRAASIALAYALSARERDVFDYLVQGRDACYISEKLFVSESTVRTHIRSIYRKMDLHSRRGLLDLVYEWPKDSTEDS